MMSGPYRPGHPQNPGAQGNQPVSFKTDINRKKTKKWTAAKPVSYDGDDWGDDDEEEYDEEDSPPPLPGTSRVLSSTHQPEPAQPSSNMQPSYSPVESPPAQSPALVRPADIYKRMQGENQRSPNSQEPISIGQSVVSAPPPQQDANAPSASPLVIPEVRRHSGFEEDFLDNTNDVSRAGEAGQVPHKSEPQVVEQGASLHHNPSTGFTSVVHQAFDVAETPTSSTENFSRSNSDSTSIISPIIGPWKSGADKTPTIAEDPTAEAFAHEPPGDFQPGHRRDLSIPSPGNGPDRIPTIVNSHDGQQVEVDLPSAHGSLNLQEYDNPDYFADQGHYLSGEVTPRPLSTVLETAENTEPEFDSNNQIRGPSEEKTSRGPSPLQIPQEHSRDSPQTMPPSLSIETSPQDMESDRLRKEIMRSFSSEHVPAIESETEDQHDRSGGSEGPASLYDGSWDNQQNIPPTIPLQLRPAAPRTETSPLATNQDPNLELPSSPVSNSIVSQPRPKLKKRFSWEGSDDSEDEDISAESSAHVAVTQPKIQPVAKMEPPSYSDNIPLSTPSKVDSENTFEAESVAQNRESLPDYPAGENEARDHAQKQAEESQAELSHVSPIPQPTLESQSETERSSLPSKAQSSRAPVNESALPAFRKIMEIQSSNEKIRVFNETREQFAHIDSGLTDWIRRSSESLPEHADIIQANGRLPGGAPTSGVPSKAKFPKLSSLGNLSLPTASSHSDGSSTGSHNPIRLPTGASLSGVMNRQNVETRGKDLLHNAGVLGGKAGGAARGLFAKGKSKLRGSDKGVSKVRGQRHRSWNVSSEPATQSSDSIPDEKEPVTLSVSSRYSLQSIPRIPSLRLGDGSSFRASFDDEEIFSVKSRSFSMDLPRNLNSVAEEEFIAPRSGSPSSFRRAMMEDDSGSSIEQFKSAHDSSITRISSGDVNGLNGNSKRPHPTRNSNGPRPAQAQTIKINENLYQGSNYDKSPLQSKVGGHKRAMSAGLPKMLPPLPQHQSLDFENQVLKQSEYINQNASRGLSIFAKESPAAPPKPIALVSADKRIKGQPSPPLDQDKNPASIGAENNNNNRKASVDSKVSNISDDMGCVEEKFDEEGIYTRLRDPSPTTSQVSIMTDDSDEDENEALQEKLDEAQIESSSEKGAWQYFPRPPGGSPRQNQPIRVVKLKPFSRGRQVSIQKDDNDTKRHSRFSFESIGNTLAEANLANGHGQSMSDNSNQGAGLQSSPIPVMTGEDAVDEAPPYPNPEAGYRDDSKDSNEEEAPAYEAPTPKPPHKNAQAKPPPNEHEDTLKHQDVRSPPPAPLHATWKTGRLKNLHKNRDSITSSSVSSIASPNANLNFPRTAISPEPYMAGSPGQYRSSQDSQQRSNLRQMDAATAAVDRPGRSSLLDGRILGRAHARTRSDNSFASSSIPSPFSPRKSDLHSHGSGDSLAAQAAMSRTDLFVEPSPLNQNSETASTTSDPSSHARLSTQFRNRIKFMGKRFQDSVTSNTPPAEREPETKPAEKKKEKKADVKKGGALSRFSGIFNRPGGHYQPAEREKLVEGYVPSESTPRVIDRTPKHARPPTPKYQPTTYTQATENQQPAPAVNLNGQYHSMPTNNKALPPPPEGYYAPALPMKTPVPVPSYSNQSYQNYANNHAGVYEPPPARYYQSNSPQPSYFYSQSQSHQPPSVSSWSHRTGSPSITSRGANPSASPDPDESRSRARDLRMRSRSPRPSPVRSIERNHDNVNYNDPIYNLGKFNVVTETARIGDQSLPFPITLPDDLANGQLSPRGSIQPEPTFFGSGQTAQNPAVGNQISGPSMLPSLSTASPPPNHPQKVINNPSPDTYQKKPVNTKNAVPIELPVPNENEEEIVMSSTAYPGQEWHPAGFEQWMNY